MIDFVQHLTNGVSLGSMYALIAIGYTMVYGILRLINFAHGDLLMVSLYMVYYGVTKFHMPWILAVVFSILITTLLGITIERLAYRPLRNASRISILVSAIGVSFLLENLATVLFGGKPKVYPAPAFFTTPLVLGGISFTKITIIIPIITLIILGFLLFFINKTKTGMAMRAVSKDYEASALMGIDVNRIVMVTFAIGSSLAAVGGVLWGLRYNQIQPLMGMMPGMKYFIAAVIGGIGNIKGAVLGGFMLGIMEIMLVAIFPTLTGYRDAFAFILLIVILLWRPQGLFGEKVSEKV